MTDRTGSVEPKVSKSDLAGSDLAGSDLAGSDLARSDLADDPARGVRERDADDDGMPDNGARIDSPEEARAADALNVPSFPVVGVGASAGGLQAFRALLRAMGTAPGVALVYIQHLSPDHESMIASILAKDTPMPVVEAGDAMRIERDHVYVIPPGKFLTVADHGLFLEPPIVRDGLRMPIDHFLTSLGGQLGNRAIGVVLSGTGTDGAIGAREVKAAGGLVIVQRPEEAEYDGMPRAAIGTGTADVVLPLADMPGRIADYLSHPYARGESPAGDGAGGTTSSDAIGTITALLSAQTDHDFSLYRRGTLGRRIMRRMSLRRLTDPADYLTILRAEPDELRALFADLLIGVTRFFREPEAWRVLESEVIPDLVRTAEEEERPLRAWVVGCSTGEEAYSLAILLAEVCEGADYQIFATDLNERAITTARAGCYPPNVADDVGPERVERHFHEHGEYLRLNKSIRERIVFAPQNVLRDPPFLRTDLVTCRNLLIYLDAKVQARVLDTFGFSLRRGGALFLGASEGAAGGRRGLEPVSAKWRIYRKLSAASGTIPIAERRPAPAEWTAPVSGPGEGDTEAIVAMAQTALLARHVPASLVMSVDGTARYFAGPVGRFLTVQPGRPTANALDMAPPELRSRLRSAVHQARAREERITLVAPRVPLPEGTRTVSIEAEALESGDGPFLISMIAEAEREPPTPPDGEAADPRDEAIVQLEGELRAVRDDLQSSIEELETTNEELKASNEEATSVNEEMQSANEELETSREELQSMNEELSTVNAQLEDKIDEMEGLYDDLSNLLRSTDLAVLFLDNDFAIRRFTPAATELLNVMDADIGRPTAHLAVAKEDGRLLDDAAAVRRDLAPLQREVRLGDAWFERVIRPFRTSENRIDGVVIVFVDVTERRRTLDRLARRERQGRAVADLGCMTVEGAGIEAFLSRVCRTLREVLEADAADLLRYDPEEDAFVIVAHDGWEGDTLGASVPNDRRLQAGYTRQITSPVVVHDMSTEDRFEAFTALRENGIEASVSCMVGPRDGAFGILGVHARREDAFGDEDAAFLEGVSSLVAAAIERERSTNELAERERTLRLATEAASMGAFVFDPNTDAARIDPVVYRLFDIDPDGTLTGDVIFQRIHEEDRGTAKEAVARAMRGEAPYRAEFRVRHRDGAVRWIAGHGDAAGMGGERRLFGVNFDITERKAMEERQRYTAGELDHRVKNVLATVSSIVSIAGRTATDFETFQRSFSNRVQSLARTHTRLADAKWSGLALRELIEDELAAYRTGETRFALSGPAIQLSPVQTQPLALALHELTTNAVKYGAIRHHGAIDVTWTLDEMGDARTLRLDWRESGVGPVAEPERHGFGWSVIHGMMEHQLDAEVRTEYGPDGLLLSYRIPLPGTVETLAAGAVMPAPTGASPTRPLLGSGEGSVELAGRRILLLDDEYLVAMQLAASLRHRGAEVVGPAFRLDEAERLASENAIDLAILDYNVGGESVAPFADALAGRGTPFVIATGYGGHIELDGAAGDAPRIRKPIEDGALDGAIRMALGATS